MALDKLVFVAILGTACALPMQKLQGGGGMPKPPFMFVPDYQKCLSTKDMGSWVSWCMPSTVANGCPMNSFNQLSDGPMAFDGPKCDSEVSDGMPKPAYMNVPHYKDCLGHKDMGNWVSLCLPSTVADGCPMDSFNQLSDGPTAFDGPKCDSEVSDGMPKPAYMNVPHYKDCLGKKKMPGNWVSLCLPSTVADGCPMDSFNQLSDGPMAFDGPKCDDKVEGMPPTPEYLNIPHYKDCLGKKDMGKWVSYCMPSTVANGCPIDSFNQLKTVFDGPKCDDAVKGMPPTPEYLNIPHYKECLGTKDMGLWVSYCMPSTVANGCPLNSYNQLKEVFDGPKCDNAVKGMPPTPEYLNVPHYKECLGHKDMGMWGSYCMPSTIANGCPQDSFNKLKDVFDGPACDDSVSDGMPKPDYLNIPHYKDCLGEKDMGKWVSFCLPSTIANGCPLDSFKALKEVFDGPACDEPVSDGMPGPKYMDVPHYKDCLGHKDMGFWVSLCMPSTIADGCPQNSFDMLKEGPMAFDGPACDDTVKDMPPTPEYMNVPHYKDCLGDKDMGNWVSFCMPATIANGCPLNSYNKLKEVFDGPACDNTVEDMPPTPEYMNVPHYKDCLGDKDMGNWVSFCMPSTIANGCPLNSYNKLKEVFDGPACDDTVEDMPPTPEYMNVPHYKDCLGDKDMGNWVSFCMPATIANGCPLNSYNKLKEVFDGPDCDDTVKAMPPTPEYLNVPHYKECLGKKDMGLWVTLCMPATIADGCPVDSFNQLKDVFGGPDCDDDTVEGMPPTPEYLNVPHYKECLGHKDFGLWWEYCMPSTIANGCPLDSFNKLKEVFDGSDCDEDVQGMPPTPEYLNIPHYKDCLGIEDYGLWSEYCMPATKTNGCPQDSWSQLSQVFDGKKCSSV